MKRSKPLTRRTPIARGAPPKRSGPIKAKPRPASETRRIYGSKARIRWLKAQPCYGCGRGPCDVAHVRSGGTGRKADYTETVALCSGINGCHARQHRMGWWEGLGMTEEARTRAAALTEQAWQDHTNRGHDDGE